ncbi:hypothetical protein SAMN04487852_110116 [Prevotella sp. tf2-5]|nr:hypothetical protein SAMN04487852_110116 [Prevotella sp. tf2-5]
MPRRGKFVTKVTNLRKFLAKCLRNYRKCYTFAPNETKMTEKC